MVDTRVAALGAGVQSRGNAKYEANQRAADRASGRIASGRPMQPLDLRCVLVGGCVRLMDVMGIGRWNTIIRWDCGMDDGLLMDEKVKSRRASLSMFEERDFRPPHRLHTLRARHLALRASIYIAALCIMCCTYVPLIQLLLNTTIWQATFSSSFFDYTAIHHNPNLSTDHYWLSILPGGN